MIKQFSDFIVYLLMFIIIISIIYAYKYPDHSLYLINQIKSKLANLQKIQVTSLPAPPAPPAPRTTSPPAPGTTSPPAPGTTSPLEIDCNIGFWSEWSECVAPACEPSNSGIVIATTTGNKYRDWLGDKTCTKQEITSCSNTCPIDCRGGSWSVWGTCNAPACQPSNSASAIPTTTGSQYRTWDNGTPPLNGGKECPSQETRSCRNTCPVDCKVSFGACSASCGGGTKSVSITRNPENGGKSCPPSESCNNHACPVPKDCEWEIGECDNTCGYGYKRFGIFVYPENGGKACTYNGKSFDDGTAYSDCFDNWAEDCEIAMRSGWRPTTFF